MIRIFYTIFIIIIIYTIVALYLSQTCCDAQAQRTSSRHPSWHPHTSPWQHCFGLACLRPDRAVAILVGRSLRRPVAGRLSTPIRSDKGVYQILCAPPDGGHMSAPLPPPPAAPVPASSTLSAGVPPTPCRRCRPRRRPWSSPAPRAPSR